MADTSTSSDNKAALQIYPGRGLGWMNLGASLHAITSRLKAHPQLYPRLSLSYSLEEPVLHPVHLDLPKNDVRLRFDGPDQRLRLIEIIGWSQSTFTYKSADVVRRTTQADDGKTNVGQQAVVGPSFRHIYNRLFGPAYAGEYIPPSSGQSLGTYILSYPGLAIRFPLKHSAYSDKADFVSLLSSAALPATSIAIFTGASWPEARKTLYTKAPPLPRSIALAGKNVESVPDEVENVVIHGGGKIELVRRSLPPFTITLSETTPQDLVAELGPPDAIFRKTSSKITIHAGYPPSAGGLSNNSPPSQASSTDAKRSSTTSHGSGLEDNIDSDTNITNDADSSTAGTEYFYNYFHHGFDILISKPSSRSPVFPGTEDNSHLDEHESAANRFVATKVFLHGNIPGSYSFNRHRRSRWTIPLPPNFTAPRPAAAAANEFEIDSDVDLLAQQSRPHKKHSIAKTPKIESVRPTTQVDLANNLHELTSEMRFTQILQVLSTLWSTKDGSTSTGLAGQYTSKGMVLNRGWSADHDSSPESSVELLGGTMTLEDSLISPNRAQASGGGGTAKTATAATEKGGGGNTQLFGFPGMLFEVLDNGGITCVSIY